MAMASIGILSAGANAGEQLLLAARSLLHCRLCSRVFSGDVITLPCACSYCRRCLRHVVAATAASTGTSSTTFSSSSNSSSRSNDSSMNSHALFHRNEQDHGHGGSVWDPDAPSPTDVDAVINRESKSAVCPIHGTIIPEHEALWKIDEPRTILAARLRERGDICFSIDDTDRVAASQSAAASKQQQPQQRHPALYDDIRIANHERVAASMPPPPQPRSVKKVRVTTRTLTPVVDAQVSSTSSSPSTVSAAVRTRPASVSAVKPVGRPSPSKALVSTPIVSMLDLSSPRAARGGSSTVAPGKRVGMAPVRTATAPVTGQSPPGHRTGRGASRNRLDAETRKQEWEERERLRQESKQLFAMQLEQQLNIEAALAARKVVSQSDGDERPPFSLSPVQQVNSGGEREQGSGRKPVITLSPEQMKRVRASFVGGSTSNVSSRLVPRHQDVEVDSDYEKEDSLDEDEDDMLMSRQLASLEHDLNRAVLRRTRVGAQHNEVAEKARHSKLSRFRHTGKWRHVGNGQPFVWSCCYSRVKNSRGCKEVRPAKGKRAVGLGGNRSLDRKSSTRTPGRQGRHAAVTRVS